MTTTNNAALATRMREARKRAGLKQRDLTHIASRAQIGRIERGEVYAPETIDAWADACKVSREWLRHGEEAKPAAAPDRSGWPVLVRDMTVSGPYYRWPTPEERGAVWKSSITGQWCAYYDEEEARTAGGHFPTPLAAADAIHARLPDEVSEAARTVAPQPIGRPLHPATSALLATLADADEGEVLTEVYNLERGCDADLDTAVYAWRDAGCPDAGNDIQFGPEITPQPALRRRTPAEATAWHAGAEYALGMVEAQLDIGKPASNVVREARDAIAFSRAASEPAEITPQPPPTNTEGDVWQELIDAEPPGRIRDLMVARREQGIAKYGRPLGRENGRDHTADAIQEALDGMVYAKAANDEMAYIAFDAALRRLLGYRGPSKMKMRAEEAEARAEAGEAAWQKAIEDRNALRRTLARIYAACGEDCDGNDPDTDAGAVHLYAGAEKAVRRVVREAKEAEDAALAERNVAAEAIQAARAAVDPTSALRWAVVRDIASALEAEATDDETVQAGAVWMAVKALRAVVPGVSNG